MDINPIIIELLNMRGITDPEDQKEFLSDKPQKTYDPFLLPDMEAGVDLILSETRKNSKIFIYGDYDADGITSTVLMYSILAKLTDKKNLGYYIPSRFEEGYGLNREAIKQIKDQGADFIITVDCGSVSYEEVEYIKELGMKVLVTDHHNITDQKADCLLINPKKPGSLYPFKDLSGCGVAFKIAQAICQKASLPKTCLSEVLDLVAIGTIGDIMSLVDENRTLVKFGLRALNLRKREGLNKLIEGCALKTEVVTSEHLSFVIVPHLNASGRIEDASQAVELLIGDSESHRQDEIVADILEKNYIRKKLQQELFEICLEEIDDNNIPNIIIIKVKDAHEGITGIVAGKIKETYQRPVIITTESVGNPGFLKGTGRSVEGLDLYELLKTQESLFEKFGGHSGACGFLIEKDRLEELKKGLFIEIEKLVSENPRIFEKKSHVDIELDVSDLNLNLAESIEKMSPFGKDNQKPVIEIMGKVTGLHYMGQDNRHAKFFIESTDIENCKVQGLIFNTAKEWGLDGEPFVRAVGKLEYQVWQGTQRMQFMVEEIEVLPEI